ncbi:arabinofuranosyltransferase [Labedaea rhizosphaerae]|uniref:arabinofuranosyltransferase n=1 Tax=Labedaea rhizosphaerae TaxID=598644 RepID=UPI00141527FF|nr:arabinofuranosyltransferase [Labedaea rhizosphaerae]
MFGAEAVAAVITASVVSFLVQWVVNRLPIEHETNVPITLTWTAVLILSCAMLILMWRQWSWSATLGAWILPAALTSVVQALELFGTPFYLNGTSGDQFFRLQYLQRLTVSAGLADDNYPGLPPFYPAGWFWLGGRFANLVGHPAWAAYKPFAIMSIAAVSSLLFVLWSLVTSRRKALGITAVLALASLTYGAYEPYRWLAMVTIILSAVLAWWLFRSVTDPNDSTRRGPATLLVGIGLSVTAATYTLVFLFGVLLLVLLALMAALVARFEGSRPRDWRSTATLAKDLTLRLVLLGLVALPLTLLVWVPYLYAMLSRPTAANAAAQVFPIGLAKFGTPVLNPTVAGAVCLLGLVWIVISWRRSTVAQAFSVILVACVLWQVLSTLVLVFGTTLLPSYIAAVGEVVLWCACGFGVIDLIGFIPRRVKISNPWSMRLLASVLAVPVAIGLTQAAPRSDLLPSAFNSYGPDGHAANPKAKSAGRYNEQLIATIATLSGKPPQDNVLLTNHYQLLDFQPYYCFQTSKEQYANPLARYPERNQELVSWSQSTTPTELLAKLAVSEFEPPNVFVFFRNKAGNYPFHLAATDFPKENRSWGVTFRSEVFRSADFASRDVGPFTVIVRVER